MRFVLDNLVCNTSSVKKLTISINVSLSRKVSFCQLTFEDTVVCVGLHLHVQAYLEPPLAPGLGGEAPITGHRQAHFRVRVDFSWHKKEHQNKTTISYEEEILFFSLHMVQEVGLGEKGKDYQNNRAISHFVAVVKL